MKISNNGLAFIERYEGIRLKAYQDSVGVWTIGIGSTRHPDGSKVKPGDVITRQQATDYLKIDLDRRAAAIGPLPVNQNQYDAILSFAYNLGIGAWNKSTLRKKILANPKDPAIRDEFMKWVNAGGKRLAGLVKRRKAEADLYFS